MMTKQRFFTHENMVSDTEMKVPVTIWQNKDQQQKFCDELNNMDVTIVNLSEHLENAIRGNTHKTITIGKLYEENEELKRVMNDILLKTECREDYSVAMYSVTVAVNPKIYKTLSELIKRGELDDPKLL